VTVGVEGAEQGLVEPFVLALGGRLLLLTGNRLDARAGDVFDEWPKNPRRDGFSAIPLLESSRCGTPWPAMDLSCTLIGPWSNPEDSSAARTCKALLLTSSLSREGRDLGSLDLRSSTAAGPRPSRACAARRTTCARDALLGAERRDRPTRGVLGPLRDRGTGTGIDGFTGSHRLTPTAEVSPLRPPEVSPMS
jgi:hypothetical protein